MKRKITIVALTIFIILAIVTLMVLQHLYSKDKQQIVSDVTQFNPYDMAFECEQGFSQEVIESILNISEIAAVAGYNSCNTVCNDSNGHQTDITIRTITNDINTIILKAGEVPQEDMEILVCGPNFSANDIGSTLQLEDETGFLKSGEYTVVGIVNTVENSCLLADDEALTLGYVRPTAFNDETFYNLFVKTTESYEFLSHEADETLLQTETLLTEKVRALLEENALEEAQKALENENSGNGSSVSRVSSASFSVNARKNKMDAAAANITRLKNEKAALENEIATLKVEIAQMDESAKDDPSILNSPTYKYTKEKYQNACTGYNTVLSVLTVAESEYPDLEAQYQASLAQYESSKTVSKTESDEEEQEMESEEDSIILVVTSDRTSLPGYLDMENYSSFWGRCIFAVKYGLYHS